MESTIMRQLWSVVEETQASVLLRLSDRELVNQIIGQLHQKRPLNSEEMSKTTAYLHAKTSLIRDLALGRAA